MADNIIAPAAGSILATKDIGDVQFPRNILTTPVGLDIDPSGTRSYAAGITALSVTTTNAASAPVSASEVLIHASAKCFVRVGSAATVNDIPLESGEKFHVRLTSGQTVNAITASGTATLNIVPVA